MAILLNEVKLNVLKFDTLVIEKLCSKHDEARQWKWG